MHWLVWIVGGLVVAFAELAIPGLIALFLGGGAVVTGVLVYFGWLDSIPSQLSAWICISLALFILFRDQVMKRFPSLEKRDAITEDQVMIGKIVPVIEQITPEKPGRVSVHQSSWKAVSSSTIEKGESARIIARDQLVLTVEKAN